MSIIDTGKNKYTKTGDTIADKFFAKAKAKQNGQSPELKSGQVYKVKEVPLELSELVTENEGKKKTRKTKMLTCRVTEEEFNIIKEKKVRTYEIFRKYLYKERIPKRTVEKKKIDKRENPLNKEFVNQLRGIATNLNQLTKLCNTYKKAPELEEIEKIRREISVLQSFTNIH